MVKPSGKTDPYAFYLSYYRSQDKDRTDPEKLRKTVRDLNQLRKPREVHAALLGYLWNHLKHAEPWMYEALALAIEMNNGLGSRRQEGLELCRRPAPSRPTTPTIW